MTKFRLKSGIWPILGLEWTILATLLKISTSNLFCPAFTLRLIGKPNKKSIGLKMTILAPEKPQKWPYFNLRFFKAFVTQSLDTSAKVNICHDYFCSC